MASITHPYFGTLDTSIIQEDFDPDVLWEQKVTFQELNAPVEFNLWLAKKEEISKERLDLFEQFIKHFPERDQQARKALKSYLEQDSEYIDFHIDELELEVPTSIDDFVTAMKIHHVALWYCLSKAEITVDYMIDPDQSDEILAVRFNLDGSFSSIAWES